MSKKDLNRAVEIVNRIAAIKTQLEAAKPLYDELDELTGELGEVAEVNQTLSTNDSRFITLVDNFADKNTVFRPAAVRRFDIILENQEELTKRREKLAKKLAKGD
jgi:hypothetical protein